MGGDLEQTVPQKAPASAGGGKSGGDGDSDPSLVVPPYKPRLLLQ